jgi:pimeloyl-ACP methyl ester carboxylesterase
VRRVRLATGVELEYAEQGGGRALLLLHGYVDSWYSWDGVLDALPRTLRAVAPSQRGHGDSEKPERGYEMARFADDAVALLDQLGIERAVVCGHSMGSFIAQQLALVHPERVAGIVLLCGALSADNPPLRQLQADVHRLADPVDRAFATEFQAGTVSKPLDGAVMARIMEETLKVPARVWHAALDGLIAWRAPRPLDRIACPTLVACGRHDDLFPLADQHALRDAIPGARLSVHDTGHALHWEQPRDFAAALTAFVNFGDGPRL